MQLKLLIPNGWVEGIVAAMYKYVKANEHAVQDGQTNARQSCREERS